MIQPGISCPESNQLVRYLYLMSLETSDTEEQGEARVCCDPFIWLDDNIVSPIGSCFTKLSSITQSRIWKESDCAHCHDGRSERLVLGLGLLAGIHHDNPFHPYGANS